MTSVDLSVDCVAAAPAQHVRDELVKVAAYAVLAEKDREAIALAVELISAKSYLAGYNHGRAGEGTAFGHWFKGCWVGPG